MRGYKRLCVVTAAVFWTSAAFGQGAVPIGEEFAVPADPEGHQFWPELIQLTGGDLVAVWESSLFSSSDGSRSSIQARRFTAEGTRGDEVDFQVNSHTPGEQENPAVAELTDGGFVVAFRSSSSAGSDQLDRSVQARRYAPDGAPSEQFQVNRDTDRGERAIGVAGLADGGFVIVWTSWGPIGSDEARVLLQAQVYAADGSPQGDPIEVDPGDEAEGPVSWVRPAVVGLPEGGFVVAWQRGTGANTSVQAQIYSADGAALGNRFQVNTLPGACEPAIAAFEDGGFVVVWDSETSAGSDTRLSIQGQRFASGGLAVGPQFQVNSHVRFRQELVTVAVEAGGGFVVAWVNWDGVDGIDVQAQRFSPGGERLGGEFRLSSQVANSQGQPSVAALAGGGFAAVWSSPDGSGSGVWARGFEPPRFALTSRGDECLDAADDTSVQLKGCHGGEGQRWRFELTSTPQRIVAPDGRCLVPDPIDASGSMPVKLAACGGPDDLWQLITGGSSSPSFLLHAETGLCLEGGTPAILAACDDAVGQVWRPTAEVCTPDDLGVCLNQERFRVDVSWHSFDGNRGFGRAVPFGTDDSGLMWFFHDENWEMLIKVLDGCAINNRFWVFAAATTTVEYTLTVTDTALGVVREYHNPLGNAAAAITDTDAFASCPMGLDETRSTAKLAKSPPATSTRSEVPRSEVPGNLKANEHCFGPTQLCLNDFRFVAEVEWRDPAGNTGFARKSPSGANEGDSGMFWFFEPDNWEMLIKVLDGCRANGRFWLLAAATTDVEYTLRVTDTRTGEVREHFNPLGNAAPAWVDTFEVCP